jgi:hypothetical protein
VRLPAALLAGSLLAALTACTPASGDGDGDVGGCVGGDDGRAAAATLLERRTAALGSGDRDAFLATVAMGEHATAEQGAWFERVRRLPEHTVKLSLGVAQGADGGADDASVTAYVSQIVQLDGIDAAAGGVEHLSTFERRDGCWRLVSDERDRTQVVAAPWDEPGTFVDSHDDVVLVSDVPDEGERQRLLDASVEAWRTERSDLAASNDRPADRGVVVMAFTDVKELQDGALLYHDDLDLTGAVTLPSGPGSDPADTRVMLTPWLLQAAQADVLPETLRHEFVHVLLARWSWVPVWATEGVAEYFATGLASDPDAAATDVLDGADTGGTGLTNEGFYAHDGARRLGNYAVAWAAMRWLATEHGDQEPAALLEALHRASAYGPKRVDRVLEERYGLTADELGAHARELVDSLT